MFVVIEFDEADLSPQVNMALRQQIVQYVTSGVRDSVYCQNITHLTPSIYKRLKMLLGIALDLGRYCHIMDFCVCVVLYLLTL